MRFGRAPPFRPSPMRRLALISVTAALALPNLGSASPGAMSFAFGRNGGNIAPFAVTISSSGAVTATGPVKPTVTVVSAPARARLAALVAATRFAALPPTIRCGGSLPDFASNFVTVRRGGSTRTVLVHGDCSTRFSRLYDALARAVGVPS